MLAYSQGIVTGATLLQLNKYNIMWQKYVLMEKPCNTNRELLIFYFLLHSLTRPWLETTIYRTRDEHANHYTPDAVV